MLQALRILDADASTKLKTAMDGWGADEGEILAILRGASAAEKTAVLDDSSLMNALESSLSRDKMLQALALLGADASTRLRAAMDGWGADEGQILQILQGASAAEKTAILDDDSLMNALESSLSRSSMIVALDHLDAHPKKKLETATDGWGVDGQEVLDIVRNASNQEKNEILSDAAFLRDPLKRELSWNEFAMAVELLGRDAPTGNDLQSNNTVVGALNTAWNASNPGNPNRGANPQEQGGWIYLDIITDTVQTESAGGGSQSSISLSNPSTVTDSIVVGNYHTHPNTGPNWQASPSPQDKQNAPQRGVPGLVRAVRNQIFPYGPNRRAHLAGSRGYPGPGGGIAPQARLDDEGNIVEDDE
jgi:microcompartment protein CcmK/EutM